MFVVVRPLVTYKTIGLILFEHNKAKYWVGNITDNNLVQDCFLEKDIFLTVKY